MSELLSYCLHIEAIVHVEIKLALAEVYELIIWTSTSIMQDLLSLLNYLFIKALASN